jgi:hypothetical protein
MPKDWGEAGFDRCAPPSAPHHRFLKGKATYYRRDENHPELVGSPEWRLTAPPHLARGYYEKEEGGKLRKYRLVLYGKQDWMLEVGVALLRSYRSDCRKKRARVVRELREEAMEEAAEEAEESSCEDPGSEDPGSPAAGEVAERFARPALEKYRDWVETWSGTIEDRTRRMQEFEDGVEGAAACGQDHLLTYLRTALQDAWEFCQDCRGWIIVWCEGYLEDPPEGTSQEVREVILGRLRGFNCDVSHFLEEGPGETSAST